MVESLTSFVAGGRVTVLSHIQGLGAQSNEHYVP